MKTRLLALVFLVAAAFVLSVGFSNLANAPAAQSERNLTRGRSVPHTLALAPSADGAQRIQAGVYVLSVSGVSSATGTYTVDMYVTFRCKKAPCKFGEWEFMNGRARSSVLNADEPLYREYRVQADLQSPPDLRNYPFDSLPIRISFEESSRDVSQLVYEVDPKMNGLDSAVNLAGWNLRSWKSSVRAHSYPQWDTDYSRFKFEMTLGRSPISAVLKSIAPGIVIVVSGLLALLLGPNHALQRVGIGTSALLGAIMFHINLTSQLPPIGYLTFADKFMLTNYTALIAALTLSVLIFAKSGGDAETTPAKLLRTHRLSQACIPVSWLVTIVAVVSFSS